MWVLGSFRRPGQMGYGFVRKVKTAESESDASECHDVFVRADSKAIQCSKVDLKY